ncbi:MAG: hypothetical protein C5B52_04655 [Bacteroidetes bacterium]|nr:MAG: hypothetical protein C5B52_04655 [Bacteroidota bacterium]
MINPDALKKLTNYIKLFWYFASNWNPVLASFLIYHDIKGEKKYHLNTNTPVELKDLTTGHHDTSKSSRYEAVNYFVLEDLMKKIRLLSPCKIFTDLGCGKGRAMVVAAHYGFTTIYGVDFAKELCRIAEMNMSAAAHSFEDLNYKVYCQNVLDYEINSEECVFFLFNPFEEEIIRKILRKVDHSQKIHPRAVYFLYVSPRFIETFFEFDYDPVYRIKKLRYLEGVILKKMPGKKT